MSTMSRTQRNPRAHIEMSSHWCSQEMIWSCSSLDEEDMI
jgi:hypothetical protein